ncbi:MAG: serine hydrolase [Lachnospiraceae bacterium]|nr:serine hydrolase [Lachnospiraceae bacterium]
MRKKRKCTVLAGCLFLLLSIGVCGCGTGKEDSRLPSYKEHYEETKSRYTKSQNEGMAEDLAVVPVSEATDYSFSYPVKAALSVNDDTDEVNLSFHAFDKVYPASITKVMTALLTLEHGNFEDKVTLSHDITFQEGNVVRSTLKKGDTVTVEGLFNALLVASDNDCAVILAEYLAGSVENFTDMMNEEAKKLGATHTHFANANGLHDSDHYTTPYDLYLIFRKAATYDQFLNTVGQKDYVLEYTSSKGYTVEEYMSSTNAYFQNTYSIPTGITVVGGKTGTTSIAKSCLILMTKNKEDETVISVVLGAENKDILYQTMSELISMK